MRFTVATSAFSDALGWATRSLAARPAQPILAGVRLALTDGALRLSTYDYEHSAQAILPVRDSDDGHALVSGRLLSEIVKNLPRPEVEVRVDAAREGDRPRMRIASGSAKFSLALMPVEDYPALPVHPPLIGEVAAGPFAEAARTSALAADKGDTLPVLAAVHTVFDVEAGLVRFTATDRYRLSSRSVPFTPAPGAATTSLLIPARSLDTYAKAVTGQERVRLFAATDSSATFAIATGERSAGTRLIDGEYPKTASLIPAQFATEVEVSVAALREVVKRVSLVAERNTPCRLAFDADGIVISAASGAGLDEGATDHVEVEAFEGDPIEIAFNFSYLTDGLATISEPNVRFLMVAPGRPAVLRAASDTTGQASYLIMPVRAPGAR